MDCVIVAGGRPGPDDPLYPYTQGKPKALLEINGRLVIDYILRALLATPGVDRIMVVGLERDALFSPEGPLDFVADQGSMVANAQAGLARIRERRPATRHVLFTSADIPAVDSTIVADLMAACIPYDKAAYYFMVDRQVMEARYPNANRTYVKLRGIQVAGADMIIADAQLADANVQLLHDLAGGRKHAWKLARIAGPATLLALVTRRLTMAGVERRAESIIGRPVSVQLTSHSQLAMDIDKPEHLLLLRQSMSTAGAS